MTRSVTIELEVKITVNDQDAITRITGPDGDEWRRNFYAIMHTENDVLEHFAYNYHVNGVDQINRLEGWADLADDAVVFGR